jgi:hypothetical protein
MAFFECVANNGTTPKTDTFSRQKTQSFTFTPPSGRTILGVTSFSLGQGGAGGWAVNPRVNLTANNTITCQCGLTMGDSWANWTITYAYID